MVDWKRISAILGAILIMSCGPADGEEARCPFSYPEAPRSETVDDYHGQRIPDPYRPLEDPDAPPTRTWVEAENRITFAFLESIPERAGIRERLTALWDYEKSSAPRREGGRYFYSFNTGLQNQSVLYTTDSLEDVGRILLDPNTLSADGTVALSGTSVSHDGRLLAYGIAAAGSDWNEWKVRDVATGRDYPDRSEMDQVLRCRVGPRRQGLLLRTIPRADSPARTSKGRTITRRSTIIRWGPISPRTAWSGRIPSTRTGAPTPTSPTTAST